MFNHILFEAISSDMQLKLKIKVFKNIIKKEIEYQKSIDKNYIYLNFRNIYGKYFDELENIWENDNDFLKDIIKYNFKNYCKPGAKYKENIEYHEKSYWSVLNDFDYIDNITYQLPACKEFLSLNNYLQTTLKVKPLMDDDIYIQRVDGKRSTIYERGPKHLLAHDPEKCKYFKKLLQSTKKPNWKAVLELKSDTYWGDRFNMYGEDMESEWNGYEYKYAKITFKTPSGKIVNTVNIKL